MLSRCVLLASNGGGAVRQQLLRLVQHSSTVAARTQPHTVWVTRTQHTTRCETGSRSGALIATAWASLVALGQDGLTDAARTIMDAACAFKHGLASQLPELSLLGQPHMGVVAFAAVRPRGLNVYCLNDLMGARGWHLNALASPPALHFCFTAQVRDEGAL